MQPLDRLPGCESPVQPPVTSSRAARLSLLICEMRVAARINELYVEFPTSLWPVRVILERGSLGKAGPGLGHLSLSSLGTGHHP